MTAPAFDMRGLLDDRHLRVIMTCGTGGVGKTSFSAAMALRAADAGRKVVLVTVDPARRLATALGLDRLGAEPEPVLGVTDGSLDALMLDMTHTFDEAIRSHAPADRVEAVLRNPFYKALSTSFSGTQDYMATEKLGQLYETAQRTGRWDLIVVDTPPSRSALDFLDAPARLDRLADGPAMRILAPQSGPLRLLNLGLSQATALISKIIGSQALSDLQVFASAFESVMGGFRRRADRVRTLLGSPAAAFVVVTSSRSAALTESRFLLDRLRDRHQTQARGVIVNQFPAPVAITGADRDRLAAAPEAYAWRESTWDRYRRQREAVVQALGSDWPITTVPAMAREITDLPAVRELGSLAAAGAAIADQNPSPTLDV